VLCSAALGRNDEEPRSGLLLAVRDARRPTRDADLSAHALANDEASIRKVVSEIAQIACADGLTFDTAAINTTRCAKTPSTRGSA
jgi:hypothetical protein